MPQYVMLIDGNSLGSIAHSLKPLNVGKMQVQAIYGFLRYLQELTGQHYHYMPFVLWDGYSWRHKIYPDYKANRKQAETPAQIKAQIARAEYKKQAPIIKKALRLLGVPQAFSINMEADDLAAIFTDYYRSQGRRILLVTGDGDWLQLLGENVAMKDLHKKQILKITDFKQITGVDAPSQFVEMKALMGDAGDNIKGVGGIGKQGAIEFLNTYGSYKDFTNLALLDKSFDLNELPKKFRALIENEDKAFIFRQNLELVDLRTQVRPIPEQLDINRDLPNKDKFRRFCELLQFNSFLKNFDDWIAVFPSFRPDTNF